MRLIEERRDRLGMSKRTAAALADMSEARWRQLEAGYRTFRGVLVTEEAPEPTLARMALAVRLTPDELRPYSEHAAEVLAVLDADRAKNSMRDADDAARMLDALDGSKLTGRQRAALELRIAEELRRVRGE